MKILYRGARMHENIISDVLKNGMRYYWDSPELAVKDVLKALEKTHRVSQLGKVPLVRSMILEASRQRRLQLFATESKSNAESYARATPELIFLTLEYANLPRKDVINYLNRVYGKPCIVTFVIDDQPTEMIDINKTVGDFIPPEFITSIDYVDISRPDPYLRTLGERKKDYMPIMSRNFENILAEVVT